MSRVKTHKDAIDLVLEKYSLYRLDNFAYTPGDCLFDAFHVLLHNRYTSIELRNGAIQHFKYCLQTNDKEALVSYQHELNTYSLMEMHNVNDPEVYLEQMSKSASSLLPLEDRGLWGDMFCIHWLSKWLSIPIRVWSKTKMKPYLYFNSTLVNNTYDILFHDENPLAGHFEPLLCKKQIHMINDHLHTEKTTRYENIDHQWIQIQNRMLANGLERACGFNSADGETSFQTICHLTENEYDAPCLRRVVAQTFSNAIMQNDSFAIKCIERYINIDILKNVPGVANWQAYIVNLALPYKKGYIEGGPFVYSWISYIWNIEICIWSAKTTSILAKFYPIRNASKVFNVIQYEIGMQRFHYEPLQKAIATNNTTYTILSSNNIQLQVEKKLSLRSIKKIMRGNAISDPKTKIADLEINRIAAKKRNANVICEHFEPFKQEKKLRVWHEDEQKQENILPTLAEKALIKQASNIPIYNCVVCHCSFFRKDVVKTKDKHIEKLGMEIEKTQLKQYTIENLENQYTCKLCQKAFEHDEIPKFACPQRIRRNKHIGIVKQLNELEERLVSPRLPFLQIRELGQKYRGQQMGLTGGVINVPTDMSRIQHALPRDIKETDTVAVAIKKRLSYKSAYAFGHIRVHLVMKALKRLCKTMLYKMEKVVINDNWKEMFNQAKDAYETDTDNESETTIDENTQEPVTKTLLHGFTDSHSIYDLQNNQINIAPGEGYIPLGIFQDRYSEELSFPTLFYGQKRPDDVTKSFTYQKISRWEILHKDHDFAYHITNLFYKAVRIILNQVLNCIWIRIRKGQLKGRKLLAKDVKSKPNLDRILKSDIGYMDLKSIRTSPDYHLAIRRNLYAMIRQLGPPTFFVTFSSAEHRWKPLINALKDIRAKANLPVENEIQDNEIETLV